MTRRGEPGTFWSLGGFGPVKPEPVDPLAAMLAAGFRAEGDPDPDPDPEPDPVAPAPEAEAEAEAVESDGGLCRSAHRRRRWRWLRRWRRSRCARRVWPLSPRVGGCVLVRCVSA